MLKPGNTIRSLLQHKATVNVYGNRYFASARVHRVQYLDATPQVFEDVVLKKKKKSKPVVVDFYADWCQPCRTLSPILEGYTKDKSTTDGKEFDLLTIDVDKHPDLASKYKVTSLPTVIGFKNGEKVDSFIGVIPASMVRKFLMNI